MARILDTRSDGTTDSKIQRNYLAFDLDPNVVVENFKQGKNVLYGDGSLPQVLETAGVQDPKALVITYAEEEKRFGAVQRLREAFPDVTIITRYGECR